MHPITRAVPGAIAQLLQAAPLSSGKVQFAWRAAVGPAMERVTAVRLEDGVLHVDAASTQWAREIGRSSSVILARLQTFLGPGIVQRLEIHHA